MNLMTDKFQKVFLIVLLITITIVFFWMVSSLIISLIFAAIFSSLAKPLFRVYAKLMKGRKKCASALTLLTVTLVVVIPLLLIIGMVAHQAVSVSKIIAPEIQSFLQQSHDFNNLFQKFPSLKVLEPYSQFIFEKAGVIVGALGSYIFSSLSSITAGTVVFLINIAIMIYAMFFFLSDGSAMLSRFLYLIPLHNKDKDRLLRSFLSMARATIKGTVVIGIVQGAGAGLALKLAGIPNALFWSAIMVVLSMIPTVGTGLVWVPACIYLYLNGQFYACVSVAIWCTIVVGSADNFLRPILIGKDTQLGELMVLISTIGGLMLFGLSGVIFGPIIGLLFVTVWDIYGIHFKDSLEPDSE